MSHSGASVGVVSHKRERYESEWSKCGSGGVSVGMVSHKHERYESEWRECVKGKKRVRVSCES